MCVLPVLTYGAEILTLAKKNVNAVQVAQRRMKRSMFDITLRDRVQNVEIRIKTRVDNAIERITKHKWS